MHKIFVGDKPIVLTTKVEQETNFKNYLLNTVSIGKILRELKTQQINSVHLIDKNESQLLKTFLKLLPNVVAAGGKVYNDKGSILFIYRNNKWDLPKGKIEGKETIEQTAIREVEEETGVGGLTVTKALDKTYHIFKRNGKYRIKITYWFEMRSSYTGKLKPQEKEGITKVKWLKPKHIETALTNSYANIKLLL